MCSEAVACTEEKQRVASKRRRGARNAGRCGVGMGRQ